MSLLMLPECHQKQPECDKTRKPWLRGLVANKKTRITSCQCDTPDEVNPLPYKLNF